MQNEPPALEFDHLPVSRSVGDSIADLALDPAYHFPDFTDTLNQLKGDNIEALATDTRYNLEVEAAMMSENPPSASRIIRIPCKVDPNPARGSYNLIFFIDFDDGKSWVIKISASGHPRCWDEFAAGALESEAFTMRWIRGKTTIPVPEVYGFDSSMDNAIECPYIMMEYIKGQSLYEGWFNPQASPARLEQFRARALQTIAAAMVQLHNLRFHTSGSLRFRPNGTPYEFQSAKVVDFLGIAVKPRDDPSRDILFAQKGPFKDPMDFLLFNFNRQDSMYSDSTRVRGLHESLRLFTQWTLEPVSNDPYPFVLGHPDFDLQNILVKEDGTVCGVLDWDGVGAVPHTVGCLKYPLWLTRDWEPSNYNYDAATGERKSKSERWENSPNENQCYRAMYAQFIEAELSHKEMDKSAAKITRLSLLAGVLESADAIPEFLYETIQNLYGKVEKAVGEEPYEFNAGFGSFEKISDSEEKKRQAAAVTQAEDDTGPTKEEEKRQEAAVIQAENDTEPTEEEEEWQEAAVMQAKNDTEDIELGSAFTGQAEEVRLQVDYKNCRTARILESSKDEDGLQMLISTCSPIHTMGFTQHPSIRAETVLNLDEGNVKGDHSERTVQASDTIKIRGTKLLSWMAQKLREVAEPFYVSADGHARIERRSHETGQRGLARAKARDDPMLESTPMKFKSKLKHSEDYPRNKKPMRPSTSDNLNDLSIASSGDVWARIGRMVQNWGIPSAMIEDYEADIAELIVQTMKKEQDRAQKSPNANALRATNAVYETQRYADSTVAELAGDQTYEKTTRELKKAFGIGPPLAKAQFTREFKPVDMELARLDPAIIAAKKSDDRKPVIHQKTTDTPSAGEEKLNKTTASEKSQLLAFPERCYEMRSRDAEFAEVENHTAPARQSGFVHNKGLPSIRDQGRANKDVQIEGSNAFPLDISSSRDSRVNHKEYCWEDSKRSNALMSQIETPASSTSSGKKGIGDRGLRSSRPLKDENGDEALFVEDTSDGGVALDAKQAFAGYAVTDDFQSMNEDEPSREKIGYYYESYVRDKNNALSCEEEYTCVDNGGFNMYDICVGLGEDTLDEERFDRLRRGFVHVLESTLGLI